MKNLFLLLLILTLSTSCSEDNGFDEANGHVSKKYLTKATSTGDNQTCIYSVSYNSSGSVNTISNGTNINYFSYNNGDLTNISGQGNTLVMSEIFSTIYEAYEVGEVLQYDSKGNPVKLKLYRDLLEYGYPQTYIANLTYDEKPFMLYYTLEAAGIIKVLNNTRLNFSTVPTAPEIIMAKLLLPVNNPIKAVINRENGQEVGKILVSNNYTTNSDDYPSSALVSTIEDNYVKNYSVIYEYKN